MLFITDNRFYLPSSPNTFAEFTSSNGNTPDTLIVKENNKILFEAVKQNTSSSKVPEFSIPNDGTLKDPH
jgi:hypothetical protein